MSILWIDPSGGASGDKLLAALVDLGFDSGDLAAPFAPLAASHGLSISVAEGASLGIRGKRLSVLAPGQPKSRPFRELAALVGTLHVTEPVRARTIAAMRKLAVVEGSIHGSPPDDVHFHEIGGLDTIVDVAGFFHALWVWGVEEVVCGPIPVGSGTVPSSHGPLPIPAPATATLLAGKPIFGPDGVVGELTTPTGALLLDAAVTRFGSLPPMTLAGVGCGLGHREFPPLPNILRIFRGSPPEGAPAQELDVVTVIETLIDDMPAELLGALHASLAKAGALESWLTPAIMKGGRPAVSVTAVAPPALAGGVIERLFAETTTFGIRHQSVVRAILEREIRTLPTPWGPVGVKIGSRRGRVVTVAPEYRDCLTAAEEAGVPVREVYERVSALAAALRTAGPAATSSPAGPEGAADPGR